MSIFDLFPAILFSMFAVAFVYIAVEDGWL